MSTARQLKQITRDVYVLAPPAARLNALHEAGDAAVSQRKGGSSSSTGGPESIVLFAWMDASLKHAAKYAERYERMFPEAHLMLVRSRQSQLFGSQSKQRERLSIAYDWIKSRHPHAAAGKESPILVHTFSNGGCFNLRHVHELFLSAASRTPRSSANSNASTPKTPLSPTDEVRKLEQKGIPARCIVFDSCPGEGSLAVSVRAFTAPIRSRLVRWPAMALVAMIHMCFQLLNFITRRKSSLTILSEYIAKRLPRVPRLYIYSRSDKLIPYESVERHIATVKEAGVPTRVERFDGTPHVNHARGNEDRYYGAIRDLWTRSSS